MSKKPKSARIPQEILEDQWHSLLLSTFLKIQDAVEYAKSHGIDQKQIGDRIGMNDGQLSRILKGDVNITLRTMHRIARAVDCRIDVELTHLSSLKKSNAENWEIVSPSKFSKDNMFSSNKLSLSEYGAGKSYAARHWIGLKDTAFNKKLEFTDE